MKEIPKTTTPKLERTRRQQRSSTYTAEEKAQAVLAVWTERARPAQVCRQLSINAITFYHWQDRAMEGMLQGLESRVNLSKGEALSPRLQNLLNRRVRHTASAHFYSRLEKIQSSSKAATTQATTSAAS